MAQEYEFKAAVGLLASDMQGSVLLHRRLPDALRLSYTPYGSLSPEITKPPLLGFNSQLRDLAGRYLLGNGYRLFSPQLMRFLSPDHLSPFEAGGINSYMYCSGDPINNTDPDGHTQRPLGHLIDPIGIHDGKLFKAHLENGTRMLDISESQKLSPEYKKAITEGIDESNKLIDRLDTTILRYERKKEVQRYITHEQAVAKAQATQKKYTGSDKGEKTLYKNASHDETMAQSHMKFLKTQHNFIGNWLTARADKRLIQNDVSKANNILRLKP